MKLISIILLFLFFSFSGQGQMQSAFGMRDMPKLDKQITRSKDTALRLRMRDDQSDTSTYVQAIKLHFDRRGQVVRIDKVLDSPHSLVRLYVQDKRLVGVFLMNDEEMMWNGRYLSSKHLKQHYPFCLAVIDAYGLVVFESRGKIKCGWQD